MSMQRIFYCFHFDQFWRDWPCIVFFAAHKPSDAKSPKRMIDISTPVITVWKLPKSCHFLWISQRTSKIRCSECAAQMVATPREAGSALIIDFGCSCGGTLRWESQTRIVKMTGKFVGNILTVISTFLKWAGQDLFLAQAIISIID